MTDTPNIVESLTDKEQLVYDKIVGMTTAYPHLVKEIHKNKHLRVEVWQAVFAALYWVPYVYDVHEIREGMWKVRLCLYDSTKIEKNDERPDIEANCFITCVDMIASTTEKNWNAYAVLSMAQTRGLGKLGRMLFGHIATMAGFSACPAEEMDNIEAKDQPPQRQDPAERELPQGDGKPVTPPTPPSGTIDALLEQQIGFGKYKESFWYEVLDDTEMRRYMHYIVDSSAKEHEEDGKPIGDNAKNAGRVIAHHEALKAEKQ